MSTEASSTTSTEVKRGDIVDFCGDQFLVLNNYGRSGRVQEYPEGKTIEPFYWNFDGAACTKVGHMTILD